MNEAQYGGKGFPPNLEPMFVSTPETPQQFAVKHLKDSNIESIINGLKNYISGIGGEEADDVTRFHPSWEMNDFQLALSEIKRLQSKANPEVFMSVDKKIKTS